MTQAEPAYLALDTSCYTTSAALVSAGRVVFDRRIALQVPKGSRGLRQSEAVFQHVKNIKPLFFDFPKNEYAVRAVACSERPRPADDSYMPVFCVGASLAASLAGVLGAPVIEMTHQHGHIYAAMIGNTVPDGEYGAVHASGGTLEVLRVVIDGARAAYIETIGGTADITCGQLIDRVGVAAGLPFPSGAPMERIYKEGGVTLSVAVRGIQVNLSGAETQAMRLLREGRDVACVCSGVIDCAGKAITRLATNAAERAGISKFIFTGGVICNRIVRERIVREMAGAGMTCVIAQKEYCTDNACGLALGAQIEHERGEEL